MSEQDVINFVKLSLQLQRESEEVMEWKNEPPTQSGFYWIYTVPVWEYEPVVMIVEVVIMNGSISFNIPCDGYERENQINPERTTHYMGVVTPPEPPKG